MKYDVKEIQRAMDLIVKNCGPAVVDIESDPRERLKISFSDTMGGDVTIITIYPSESSKMATITRTTRM